MTTSMSKMAWEKKYSDDSAVSHAVRFDADECMIEFESMYKVEFPQKEINWLIDCLQQIKKEQGF